MEIKISGKHLELTAAIDDYAVRKVQNFPRYFNRVQHFEIAIYTANNAYTV